MEHAPSNAVPYPGLRSFLADEAGIFFGREQQTDELLTKLQGHRFIAVTGPSGCGKSSLIKAGLIPALRAGFMLAAGSRWRFCEIRPGQQPISTLAAALASPEVLGDEHEELPFVDAALRFGPLGLIQTVRESGRFHDASLLVLVDQFEEIFRYRERIDPDEADAFVRLLLASAAQTEVPIYVVITMRSDYLGDCALFHGLPEAINAGQYLTPRLTREQCSAAIVGPARVFGGDVDPVLVNRLLNDFGPDPDQLPLLQHALMRMWMRERASQGDARPFTLTIDDYNAVGGLAQALAQHADEALAEVAPAQKRLAETLFRRLTERGTSRRDTRAPARLGEVAAVAAAAVEDVAGVVTVFRGENRNFVTAPERVLDEDTWLDIGHESLIRQWGTLARWVDDEAESALMYKRLVESARLWKRNAEALWRPPGLGLALAWRQAQQPNAAWAARYSSKDDFDLAMAFLNESDQEWRAEQARIVTREEEERERERERLAQDAQRVQLEAEAKTARAEAELERTKAAGERQARRNRTLRIATVLLSIGVLSLLAVIAGYRYFWVSERADFYNTYVKTRRGPSGVGRPLTSAELQRRESAFKIVRRGVRGPVMRLEKVDNAGRLTSQGVEGNARGYLGNSADQSDRNRTVKAEYVYGNDNELAYEVEFDARGRQVASMVYTPSTDKRVRTAHFFGPGGEAVAPGESCADYVQFEYSPEGYEARVRYMDRQGKPAPGRDHALEVEQHYDQFGNTVEMISLDGNGKRMTDRYGNAVARARFDALGNQIETTLYDEHDAATVSVEGWFRAETVYDSVGNRVETKLFDENGGPTVSKEGWHRFVEARDARGSLVGQSYWGLSGEPTTVTSCHEYRFDHDDRGRITNTTCLGVDGRPTAGAADGVPTWRRAYDDEDNVIEFTFFDAQGAAVNTVNGYHRVAIKHDDRGNSTEFAYFGTDGKPVTRREGYARMVSEFQGSQEVRSVYLDANGKPTATSWGYTERRYEYDTNGNQILEAYFDASGRPQEQSDGAVARRRVYDACGQVTEIWYLGPNGSLRNTKEQYAGVRYVYDRLGRISKTTFLDVNGRPTLSANRTAGFDQQLDSRGNKIGESYFDTEGRPVAHKDGHAGIRATFDQRSNRTSLEFLGPDQKPSTRSTYPRITYKYDAQSHLVETAFFRLGSSSPAAVDRLTYNALGQNVEARHFNNNDIKTSAFEERLAYDDLGRVVETAHLGPGGEDLYGVERFKYNGLGQKTEEAYFDSDNRPMLHETTATGNCARALFAYDPVGNVSATQCFDLAGKLVPARK